ncbi:MAG: hypothetical protein EOP83_07090, partial [Verrucomicrobiaceae bacterium]
KLHMRRVDDLLAEYQNLSGGKLRVEQLDPQPDTDAEDAANLDGIRGQRMDDQNLYFGLAVSCIDRTATIPFIDPSQETMLEYEISKAISEVSRATKPVIGMMSGLPIAGEPQNPMAMMQGQQSAQPWVFYSQLAQSYEVKDLTLNPAKIDPEIDVLLVFHPANITPEAEFAIDQYVLQGGTVIACVDPMSVAAQMTGGGNPMMGGGGAPTASTLPTLLGAWGVSMSTQVVGDLNYQTTMSQGRQGLAVLTVPQEGMPQRDKDVITKNINSLTFFLPGGFTKTGSAGVAINSLVKSSDKSGLVDAMKASQLDPALSRTIKDPKSYDLVMHLKGNFKTAFPKGKPGEEEKKDEAKEGEKKEEEKKEEKPAALTEATKEGNVFLISDIDIFFDQFAYRVQRFGGMQMAQPLNGNSSLFFNIVDQAASSTHLIGARSRAAIARPFTKIKDLESEFTRKSGEKIEEKQKELDKVSEEINTLVQQRAQGDRVFMDSDLEAKIREGRAQQVSARKELRDMEKELKREKDKISGKATLYNVAAMPLLVILIGLGLFIKRRTSTRAR